MITSLFKSVSRFPYCPASLCLFFIFRYDRSGHRKLIYIFSFFLLPGIFSLKYPYAGLDEKVHPGKRRITMYTLATPTRDQCFRLISQIGMPPHIQRHSLMVAEISLYLGRLLKVQNPGLDLDLLQASALLHDIAKAPSLVTGESHSELGAKMLDDLGYMQISPIVKEHASMEADRLIGPITESLIVNYSDKRVKHDQIVSLEDRFCDLMDRYGKTQEHKDRIWSKLELYLALEKKIFAQLPIDPGGRELMSLSPQNHAGIESEHYDWEKIESGVIGRWQIRRA